MKKSQLSQEEQIFEKRFIKSCFEEISNSNYKCVFSSANSKQCDYIYTHGWHLSGLRKHLYTKKHRVDFENEFKIYVENQRKKPTHSWYSKPIQSFRV